MGEAIITRRENNVTNIAFDVTRAETFYFDVDNYNINIDTNYAKIFFTRAITGDMYSNDVVGGLMGDNRTVNADFCWANQVRFNEYMNEGSAIRIPNLKYVYAYYVFRLKYPDGSNYAGQSYGIANIFKLEVDKEFIYNDPIGITYTILLHMMESGDSRYDPRWTISTNIKPTTTREDIDSNFIGITYGPAWVLGFCE